MPAPVTLYFLSGPRIKIKHNKSVVFGVKKNNTFFYYDYITFLKNISI